ncbi:MAG: type II secretion system F family protein [Actinomycetota bacterium]
MSSLILMVVLTVFVLALAVAAVAVLVDAANRQSAIQELTRGSSRSRMRRIQHRIGLRFRRTGFGRRLADQLAGADIAFDPIECVVAVSVAAVTVLVFTQGLLGWLGSLICATAVVYGSHRWLERRRRQRVEAFVVQLPEVARVLANAASAGLALRRGIRMVADELPDPAHREFATASSQMDIVVPWEEALAELDRRLPSRELRVLLRTLVIQSRAGGALVSALVSIASTLEQRRELRREVRTAVAGAMFSGYLVAGLGVCSVIVMNLISPGALDALAGSGIGRLVLLVAAGFFVIGFAVIRRLTMVEV